MDIVPIQSLTAMRHGRLAGQPVCV